jgi:hypothetical protein
MKAPLLGALCTKRPQVDPCDFLLPPKPHSLLIIQYECSVELQ